MPIVSSPDIFASINTTLPGSTLATPEQILIESRALEIYRRAEIAELKLQISKLFNADRNSRLADQAMLIAQSIDEHCFHAALIAASETPRSPSFVWSVAAGHQWMGLQVPGSRMGQDNPDNTYRFASVDPTMEYRIAGRFVAQSPTDFSICSLPAQVGENIAANVCAIITRENIDIDGDGYFEILLDASPSQGQRNHLSIAGAKVLMCRDTLVDWSVERPSELRIERTDGASIDDFDLQRASARAVQLGITIASFFLNVVQHGMCEVAPLNTIQVPVPSGARGGLVTQSATLGYYRLGDHETLVVSVDRLGAHYLGIQLVDMWLLSYEYRHRTSSMNHFQAIPDSDGRYRWVISARDPGVYNWLDGSGNDIGTILLRWHGIPSTAEFSSSVTAEVVKISELPAYLPADTQYTDSQARSEQQTKRFREYNFRVYADEKIEMLSTEK